MASAFEIHSARSPHNRGIFVRTNVTFKRLLSSTVDEPSPKSSGNVERREPFVALPLRYMDALQASRMLTALFDRGSDIRIVVDEASNTLHVSASEKTMKSISSLIREIDNDTQMHVVSLRHIEAEKAAQQLKRALGDRTIPLVVDYDANSIIILTSAGKLKQAKKLLQNLDKTNQTPSACPYRK